MEIANSGYAHVQRAPLCLTVYITAAGLLIGAWFAQSLATVALALTVGGVVTAVIATAFHHLTVMDLGESLAVRFGPLPLPMFRMTIPYEDMKSVEVGRTLFVEGWGIHLSPRGGWVWNIWGRDCIVIQRRDSVLRIGSNDANNLALFLEGRISQQRL